MDVSKNSGFSPPNHPFKNRVFHYFHHPFWGFSPYFWEHPYVYVGFRFCGSSALHVESLCLDVSLIMTSPSNDPKSHWSQCECEIDDTTGWGNPGLTCFSQSFPFVSNKRHVVQFMKNTPKVSYFLWMLFNLQTCVFSNHFQVCDPF